MVNNGHSRDKVLMHLLRCLFFKTEHFGMSIMAVHLDNIRADALSRNDLARFLQAASKADRVPTQVPGQVLALLVEEQPDWISPRWTELFAASIRQV